MKIAFAILATAIGLAAFAPYIRDVWTRKTQPHIFTWLIWTITQGTATAGLLYGNGGYGAIPMTISIACTIIVITLALRNGTKNITRSDVIVMLAAISAIFIWWGLDSPMLAVLMVSAIDAIGYIPTFRKSFKLPWSETAGSWFAFAFADGLAILAIENFNLLTVSYLATITACNILLVSYLAVRRIQMKKVKAAAS